MLIERNKTEAENLKLINELEVYKAELEFLSEELKIARADSKEAVQRYTELYHYAPTGYFTLSREGRIIELNHYGSQMFGISLSKFSNIRFDSFVSAESRPVFRNFLEGIFNSSDKASCDLKLLNFDIFPIHVQLTGIVTVTGEQCLVIVVDITERKKAEQLLKDIVEKNPISIQILDKCGLTLMVNPAYTSLFGPVPPPEHSIFDDLEKKFPGLREQISIARDGKVVHLPDILYNEKDTITELPDNPVWISTIIFPLIDKNGAPDRYVLMYENITGKKKSEEEIRKLNDELEQRIIHRTEMLETANTELEAFSYSVSHDLRAPIRHISGFAEILKNEYYDQLPGNARHYLDSILGSAQKMGVLIDETLSFSKTGSVEFLKASINMNDLADEALSQIRLSATGRIINWSISILPDVYGVSDLLRQVWINLFDNAVKYTSTRAIATITIGYEEKDTEIVFFVRDNGVGFDMKYYHKLFGVFQRLHSQLQFDGIGIGLANVRRIISRHGGRTWAEAEVDKGASFYFSIPKRHKI